MALFLLGMQFQTDVCIVKMSDLKLILKDKSMKIIFIQTNEFFLAFMHDFAIADFTDHIKGRAKELSENRTNFKVSCCQLIQLM